MLAELDIVVFLQSHDSLERTAERVFGALSTSYQSTVSAELGDRFFEATGLGFTAMLYANEGERADPWFERYGVALEIASQFWCVDLDTVDMEGPLSEYYGRLLAFSLDVETATAILLETTEEGEWFEVVAYRRNPQFRLDQAPTTPKVMEIERRRELAPVEDEEPWEAEQFDADVEEIER